MPAWLTDALRLALGLGLLGGVFWLAFRHAPARREDAPANDYTDDGLPPG